MPENFENPLAYKVQSAVQELDRIKAQAPDAQIARAKAVVSDLLTFIGSQNPADAEIRAKMPTIAATDTAEVKAFYAKAKALVVWVKGL